jgi:electron transfer flavoprotein-quinone oxidoreductase
MRPKDTVVAIIGGGAAGITAAIGLAKRRVPVVVIEGAPYPGAENWSGAVYFCENLARPEILGPAAFQTSAVERRVVKRGLLVGDGRVAVGGATRSKAAFEHCYTVLRPVFDHDLAAKARLFGAEILSNTTALALLRDGDRVLGVLTDRGPIYADLVFLAEGDASRLVTREGLETKRSTDDGPPKPEFLQGVKEVLALDPAEIERRFGVGPGEGACFEILLRNGHVGGKPVALNAGAFLYTNRESVSLGFVAPLDNLKALNADHNVVMEMLKGLPALKGLLAGAETKSFGAKLIRGGGFDEMPRLVLDGLVVGGAAAGLGVDFPCPNYTGPATFSGFLISEAVAKIRAERRGFDAATLAELYEKPLRASHYVADSKRLRTWPHFVSSSREFFGRQVDLVAGGAHVLTAKEFGPIGRHILFARRFVDLLPRKKVGPFVSEMNRAASALGLRDGMVFAFLRALPFLLWNCVFGWLPRSTGATGATFEPLFFSDPETPRRKAPLSVRYFRARFSGALADALHHLYRNDASPLERKTAAARDAVLRRLSLVDLLLVPIALVVNLVLGLLHKGGFYLWAALARPSLDAILKTPAFRLKEEERLLGAYDAVVERTGHDDKLASITYRGEERSHVKFHVRAGKGGVGVETESSVFHVCPARVYREERDQSLRPSVAVLHENCVKCETCWRADSDAVDWGRTRGQRLAYEAYTSADAWTLESLEAAAAAEAARRSGVEERALDEPAPTVASLTPELRAAVVPLFRRARRGAASFRDLHDLLPSVLTPADRDLLSSVVDDVFDALEELDRKLRGAADDTVVRARLDALVRFRELARPRRVASRFFDLEADFALLLLRHLPDLERRLGVDPSVGPRSDAEAALERARARKRLRDVCEARLGKEVVAASEAAGGPDAEGDEALRALLRDVCRRANGAPLPGSVDRDLLMEELARRSPSFALLAHAHLLALDALQIKGVVGDEEDLFETLTALRTATPLSSGVRGDFSRDAEGAVSGSAIAVVGGAKLLVVVTDAFVAVFGLADDGVVVEAPGSLGLRGAGLARVVLRAARPRALFEGAFDVPAKEAARDVVAIARGMTAYAAERAIDHAESRVQFPGLFRDVRGRDGIAKFGAVQAMLAAIAEARAALEALASFEADAGLAAAFATDVLAPGPRSVLYLAGQALGGTAYSEEDPMCRFFRDGACLNRFPREGRPELRRHGRRFLKLVRGKAGGPDDLCVGLDLRPLSFVARSDDPRAFEAPLRRVREAFGALRRALESLDAAGAEALAVDLGRAVAYAGAFDRVVDAARRARASGPPDPSLEAAVESLAERVASKAERLARRVADVPALVDLGARLLSPGVAEGPSFSASGATTTYEAFLHADDPFKSGDMVARPGRAGAYCWSPELLDADPVLGAFRDETVARYRAWWRDRDFDGLPYPRLVERLHHVPIEDVRRLLDDGAFRRVIPKEFGGLGWKKAKYYVDCVAMMRHGDPALPLIVMGSTSIGTTPILIGLEQDLPSAAKAAEDLLAHPERVEDVARRLKTVRRMADGVDALKVKAPFEELLGVAKKTLLSDKALKLVFGALSEALMDAGKAGLRRDLAGFRKGLDQAAAALEGRLDALRAEAAEIPARAAMHAFYLRLISSGRISAFALTEPSAGSDTARIRTRADRVEVEAQKDPLGFYVFTPEGGREPRNLFPIDRFVFDDGAMAFVASDGTKTPIVVRDFKDVGDEGPAKVRYVELGGRRVDVHDMGRVVERGGKTFFPYFRVNGAKMWITNGSVAGVMSLYARTDRGPTGFMLDAHQEGLVVGKDEEKMGQRGSATNELALKDVRIPIDAVIGVEGRGQENALETLNVGRAGLAATSTGLMHEVVDDVRLALARLGREPSPADLLDLGKAAVDLAGSEALAYQLVGRFDHKGTKSIRVESAIGKAETSEALHRLLTRAERVVGPDALLAEGLLEKRRRDARVLTIYEGTNEIQRFLVLKDLVDALETEPPPIERPETTSSGVAAGLAATEAARREVLSRVAKIRESIGSKAWQDVALQPWMFGLVDAYAATCVMAATVRRTALAHRLIADDRGRPRLEFLDAAATLMAKAVVETSQGRLAAFDREAARLSEGRGPSAEAAADRATLAHGRRKDAPPASPRVAIAAPTRVLVLVDPSQVAAPKPRVRDGALAEAWFELSDGERGVLRDALRLKSAAPGLVSVDVVGVGSGRAASVLEETLALGADRAMLLDTGRRALLAPDVASAVAEWVRLEEDLRGRFDLVLGSEANVGFLLPTARRLDLPVIGGVAAIGADVGEAGAAFTFRIEGLSREASASAPLAASSAATAHEHEFAATIEGFARARRVGVRSVAYRPSEAPAGVLTPSRAAPIAAAAASDATLDAAAAAETFADVVGLSGETPVEVEPYEGAIASADDATFKDAGAILVLRIDRDGPTTPASSLVQATRALSGGRPARVVAWATTDDDAALRAAAGPLVALGVDVVFVMGGAFGSDSALARSLERLLAPFDGSLVFASDLREVGLLAGEGRVAEGRAAVLFDRADRIETSDERRTISGKRLDGKAVYAATRPILEAAYVVARGELVVEPEPPAPAHAGVVFATSAQEVSVEGREGLERALLDAKAELGVESLADAEFILDVGYGVGSRDGLEEVVEPMRLALERLGVKKVTIGASRKVTQDLGLLPDSCQIGQTGVAVDPKFMIALGVSGAPQHLGYVGERAVIFSFNKDPEAPLMTLNRSRPRPKVYPVLGDLFEEAPKFLKALESAAAG